MRPRGRAGATMFGVAVTVAMLAVGCSGGESAADKAGGPGEPVVLTMANTYTDLNKLPAVQSFVSQVEVRSDGNLRIKTMDAYGNSSADAEQQVVRAVADGTVDLGWAPTRVFDTMGVTAFQALQAPMLIDSYALEQAVITAGIPGQMLQGVDRIGVRGLGVLADGLRKPVAVKGALLGPTDWRGLTFGTLESQGQALAIRALGATPMVVQGDNRKKALNSGKLQGFEHHLLVYQANALAQLAPYVTANVNLWPQMDVLLANPDRFAALSEQQRSWLDQAAHDATERSVALADQDAQIIQDVCKGGARFANASKADLAALNKALAPVFASLEKDPQTKAFIQQIENLKRSTPADTPLAIPADCTGKAPEETVEQSGTVPAELNGTYRYVLTKDDARKGGEGNLDEYPSVTTVALRDGQVKGGCFDGGATYWVNGKRVTFNAPAYGYTMTVTFSTDAKGNLHLTPVQPMDRGDAFVCFYKPWTKIS